MQRRQFLKFDANRKTPSDGYWLHVHSPAMACRFEVTLPFGDEIGVRAASDALAEAGRLEAQLTIFRESSEVSFINRHAASRPVRVEPSLFALLARCRELYGETGSAFDITSGPLSHCWGFSRRQGRIPEPDEIATARSRVGGDRLCLDGETCTIRFSHPGMEINLGSIGKGYALDCIAAKISDRVRTALLSAGSSSMRAIGLGDGGGWVAGIRHPGILDRRMAVLRMRDCAMATSGCEEQFFEHEGKRYGHIIDPRTGFPAEGTAGVTVVADSAATADALATAFYVGGRALAEIYCTTHPNVLAVMLESGAEEPVVIGNHDQCEVEIIHEPKE